MKALTLYQPWGTLVALGKKHIETRSWFTPYRGPLAIHISKRIPAEYRHLCDWNVEPFASALEGVFWEAKPTLNTMFGQSIPGTSYYSHPERYHLGCVIATCELVGVDQFGEWVDREPMIWRKGNRYFDLTDKERAFGDYTVGRFGWFLANAKMLPTPIPAKGSLGLWDLPKDIEKAILAQGREA